MTANERIMKICAANPATLARIDAILSGEDIAKLILSQLGELPPTDDPSAPEPVPEGSPWATQSETPDSVSLA